MSSTLYDILEVSPDASAEIIHSAYRALAQRWHPDKNAGDPAAADLMVQINRAYAILSDPLKRKVYDASLPAAPRPRAAFHETNPDSSRSSSFPPPAKSARKDDGTEPSLALTSFLVIGLLIFIAMVVYLVFFHIDEGPVTANAELGRLLEQLESTAKKERTME